MLERERLESKKISKTNAVTSQLPYDLGEGNVHVAAATQWFGFRCPVFMLRFCEANDSMIL